MTGNLPEWDDLSDVDRAVLLAFVVAAVTNLFVIGALIAAVT